MRIHELTLPSTQLEAQFEMYSNRLGFACEWVDRGRMRVKCGATSLNFVRAQRQFYFHYCFLVPTGSVESICRFLDDRDFQSLLFKGQRTVQFSNGRSVYYYDADQNIAEFIERPMLNVPVKPDFDVADVLRINEIGIPAEQPIVQAEAFIKKYGIVCADDAVFREDFVWCGDYEGVFIMPKIGRNWLPTDRPAEKNELRVGFSTQRGKYSLEIRVN